MKIIFKGILKKGEQFPSSELPKNAVKFKEPSTIGMISLVSIIFAVVACMIFMFSVNGIAKLKNIEWVHFFNFEGLILCFLSIVPHELIHGLCFRKNDTVNVYFIPRNLMAAVWSDAPLSKMRFIWMSIAPTIAFGIIPMLLWVLLPADSNLGRIMIGFASYSIAVGSGDFMNIFNALIQMPKGSYEQLSGLNSYWFTKNYREEK